MTALAQWLKSRFPSATIRRDGEAEMQCPLCGKPRKAWFNALRGKGFCFSCRQPFNATKLVALTESIDAGAAFRMLQDMGATFSDVARMSDDPDVVDQQHRREVQWPTASAPIMALDTPLGSIARVFCYSRGLDDEAIAYWRLRVAWWEPGCPEDERRFSYRVLFPYYRDGKLVYWGARRIDSINFSDRKLLYPPIDKQDLLYNLDVAQVSSWAAVVEGQIDALRVGRNAVALGGSSITNGQVASLRRAGFRRLICMMDADDAGTDALIPLLQRLVRYPWEVRVAAVPRHRKDPGECTAGEITAAFQGSVAVRWDDLGYGAAHLLNECRSKVS